MRAQDALLVAGFVAANLAFWGWKIGRPRAQRRSHRKRYGDLDNIVSFSGRLVAGEWTGCGLGIGPKPRVEGGSMALHDAAAARAAPPRTHPWICIAKAS